LGGILIKSETEAVRLASSPHIPQMEEKVILQYEGNTEKPTSIDKKMAMESVGWVVKE
jgi:hypothetical protein